MRVLLIGSGGREHALGRALALDPAVTQLHAAPGNPGLAAVAELHQVSATDPEQVTALLSDAPGIALEKVPSPLRAAGRDEVFVGRIRADDSAPNAFSMFVVSDNLRKGAATNAVQIAELLAKVSALDTIEADQRIRGIHHGKPRR